MVENYVVIDLEMTGLKANRDKIIEIGAVKVKHHQVMEHFQCMVNPHRKLPDVVEKLTGITNQQLSCGLEENEAIMNLISFCGDFPIVGHNILFDFSFIKQSAVNHNIFYHADGIDTLKLARKFLSHLPHKKLDDLCSYYQIEREKNHRALMDAIATNIVYRKLLKEFGTENHELFEAKPLHYKVKKQGPITKNQIKLLNTLLNYHKIDLQLEVESLTKNEASRITDQILSQYGRISGVPPKS